MTRHGTWTPSGSSASLYTQTLSNVGAPLQIQDNPLRPECRAQYGSTASTTYAIPKPTCGIGGEDCAGLWSSFLSANPSFTVQSGVANGTGTPACSPTGSAFSSAYTDPNENDCKITGNHVKVHYWPASRTRADPCATGSSGLAPPSASKLTACHQR